VIKGQQSMKQLSTREGEMEGLDSSRPDRWTRKDRVVPSYGEGGATKHHPPSD